MTNKFEKAYQEYKIYKKEFGDDIANIAREEEAVAAYRVLSANLHERGPVFVAIYRQYEQSRDNGNENLDFNDYILDVGKYVECLRENGVKCFTISSRYVGAIEKAMEFQKAGCRMTGLKEVKGRINPWSEKREPLPALVFEIN